MAPVVPKLEIDEPHTPRLAQNKWSTQCPEFDTPHSQLASPGSPDSLPSPVTPVQNHWTSLDGHVIVADADSPRALMRARSVLSRQGSLKKQPEKIGQLTLGSVIGMGSFSRTYYAYGPQGTFAIKSRRSTTSPELFEHEEKILNKLGDVSTASDSQHIVRFHPELSETDNLVFDLYENSLQSLVLSPEFAIDVNNIDMFDFRIMSQPVVGLKRWVQWAEQLVTGLRALHARNIVHADFKPDNILVKGDQLAIADFSSAIDLEDANPESLLSQDRDGGMAWSPVYTDPEVRAGQTPSVGSDIYSLGLVLAFCATGQEPYSAAKNSTQRLMWMDKVEPLQSYDMDIQPKLSRVRSVIEHCLTRSLDGIEAKLAAIS